LPPSFVLVVGLLVASRVAPILLVWPWRLANRFRHVVGDTTTFSFDSTIFVDKCGEGINFPQDDSDMRKFMMHDTVTSSTHRLDSSQH